MSYRKERWLAGRQEVLAHLDEHAIAYEETHHAVVTSMLESARLGLSVEGVRCKNLLMQDKKKRRLLLVVAQADRQVDAASLGRGLGCGRLSLCSADLLLDRLGVVPGALSPLALINDKEGSVELVIDESLCDVSRLLFHPLVNTSTIALARDGWGRFLSSIGCEPTYVVVGGI